MKSQDSKNVDPSSLLARVHAARNEKMDDLSEAKKVRPTLRSAVTGSGRPLGWIERTLLAVDGHRVFIDVSDPRLREELVAANEAEHRDVIAASNIEALFEFMARLPVPKDCGNDIVIADEDFSRTKASELFRQLEARGWSIPVLTVSARKSLGATELAQ
jgi:hypothetical protein